MTFKVVKKTFFNFADHNCPQMAAALAYYAVFSMPPLLVIAITIASYGVEAVEISEGNNAQETIVKEVTRSLGVGAAEQVRDVIDRASKMPRSTLGVAISSLVFMFGASGVMVQLQSALNKIWGIAPDPNKSGIKHFLLKRLLSFAMVLGVGFILLVSLLLTALLGTLEHRVGGVLAAWFTEVSPLAIHGIANLLIAFLVFAALFKWLPDALVAWRNVWIGALATTLLFVAGKAILAVYFSKMDVGSTFGAAGSLALILLWVYYSGMIFLLGAEFTHALSLSREEVVQPQEGAVLID